MRNFINRSLVVTLLMGGAVPIVGSLLLAVWLPEWRWDNIPVHAAVESVGGFAALSIAAIIVLMRSYNELHPGYIWLSCGLIGMGMLDIVHALLPAGQLFVWTHSTATFIGGIFFALIWLPEKVSLRFQGATLPLFVAALTGLGAALSYGNPQSVPAMVQGGHFTAFAKILNVAGGIGFLVAAGFFLFSNYRSVNDDKTVFSTHAFLFGVAGILFETSVLWDPAWWLWHVLRMIAYLVAIYFFFKIFRTILVAYEERQMVLEQAVEERTSELVAARNDALSASRAKSEFLSNMSHEIRTPMNGILMSLNLALTQNLSKESQELIATAHMSTHSLLNIINDILDFSKMESGKLEIQQQAFSTQRSLSYIAKLFKPLADDKGILFECMMDENVPQWVEGDSVRVQQVISNFVSNAIKFTYRGKVVLHISFKATGDKVGNLHVAVEDTGAGISTADQNRLFQRFSQLENETGQYVQGTGLGLAISKQLAILMDGSIGVESDGQSGSKFWFEIPVKEVATAADLGAKDRQYDDANLDILVAEDIPLNQMLIKKTLLHLGHNPVIVNNGREAVNHVLSDESFDLVLMDNQMPKLSGMDAISEIRKSGHPRSNIPIIALTADALEEQKKEFFARGADGFVSKPIDENTLQAEMGRVIALGRKLH